MRIIPAIDIIGGKCVRLTKGDYSTKKIYNESPLDVALEFQDNGIEYLHVVDLDGAKSSHIVNHKVLETIASRTNLKIDFGGGLKTDEDLKIAFESGAQQITGGSIAVKNPEIFEGWIKKYGSDKIILGADVMNEKIAVAGWQEDSGLDLYDFLDDYTSKGIKNVICTDISKDGMLEGASVALYIKMIAKYKNINLTASGGVSNIADLMILRENGLESAIVGKAIYEERISMKQLQDFILSNG
ncbi:MAG: 1-(5-phosphoribosyl)-5-[(5-phosphoribosylamino)methylideneamino]imidazole-4-carboxamide isomerase [Ichthyobacteriaceae bacterium]|nr:1-(5-phosphoribosyl)-5-[(5-phosphoribosylamino)methylideneamino]imidazole-4-carboxamide isomerase [Ichthyobacteriaceae bacterium]